MIKARNLAILCIAIALAGGCATSPKTRAPCESAPVAIPPEPAPVLVEPPRPVVPSLKSEVPPPPELPTHQSDIDRLLIQYDAVRKMGPPEAGKELEQARQAFSRIKSDYNRVQLALLTLLPNTGQRDDGRAAALLDPMLRESAKERNGPGLRALAALLYNQIVEDHKLEERMKEEQKKADLLQQKLDALMQVEKSLIDREQTTIKKK